jgi:4-amino-4-deoxy-L-arabinose transferase-like glycosyltransferase
VFLLVRGNLREGLRRLGLVRSVAVAIAVAGPWFAAMTARFGPEFLDVFLLEHNLLRFVKAKEGHGGPPVYYVAVLLVGFFPWVTLLPGALKRAWPRRGDGRGEDGGVRPLDSTGDLPLFTTVWALVVLVFFSVSGTKLPQYIAPAYPALAILVGLRLADLRTAPVGRWPVRIAAAIAVLLGAALLASPRVVEALRDSLPGDKIAESPFLQGGAEVPGAVLLLGAGTVAVGVAFLAVLRSRPSHVPTGLAAGTIVVLVLSIPAASAVDEVAMRPLRDLSRQAGLLLPPDEPVHVFSLRRMPSIGFYSDRGYVPVRRDRKGTLRALVARGRPFAAIAPRSDRKRFRKIEGIRVVREEGGYVLVTGAE